MVSAVTCASSTRRALQSQKSATVGVSRTLPCAHRWTASQATASCECRQAMASLVVRVVVAAPGATDHDLVFLDRDLHGAVTRPVLGVDGVVLDGGVEPQAVALLA